MADLSTSKTRCVVCGGAPYIASPNANEAVFCSLQCKGEWSREESRTRLRLIVDSCESLMDACDMAQHYADRCACDVEFEFNSVRCVAEPNGDGKLLAERQAEAQNTVFVVRSRSESGGTVFVGRESADA